MTATKDDQLDERFLEIGRLRARVARAEGAVGRVLALCDQANRVSPSDKQVVYVADVRREIAGTA